MADTKIVGRLQTPAEDSSGEGRKDIFLQNSTDEVIVSDSVEGVPSGVNKNALTNLLNSLINTKGPTTHTVVSNNGRIPDHPCLFFDTRQKSVIDRDGYIE